MSDTRSAWSTFELHRWVWGGGYRSFGRGWRVGSPRRFRDFERGRTGQNAIADLGDVSLGLLRTRSAGGSCVFSCVEQVCRDLGRWSLIFLLHIILVRCAVHGIGVGCRRRSGVARSQSEMRYVWKRRREPWLRPWWLERIQINQVPVVFDIGRDSAT